MANDRSPGGMDDRFLAVCVSIFGGALALNLAVQLLSQIWVQLLIGLAVVGLIVGAVFFIRWRRDRW